MVLESWMFGAVATFVIVGVYAVIAFVIGQGIIKGRDWSANPLALATCAIFFACSVGHGLHLVHALLPIVGIEVAEGIAHRVIFADWRLLALDGATAAVAVWYISLRARLPGIYGAASLYEDIAQRQMHARVIHDEVVVGLRRADALLKDERPEDALAELDKTMGAAKGIITDLLGPGATLPGRLRRERV